MNSPLNNFKDAFFLFAKRIAVFMFICFFFILSGDSRGMASGDKTWIFEFDKASIAEILTRISTVSEREIILEGQVLDRIISRSYTEKTILHILRDVFQGNNYVIVMEMNGDHAESYHIKTVGQGKKSDNNSNNVTQTFFRETEKSIHRGGQVQEKTKKSNRYSSKNNSDLTGNQTGSMPLPPMPEFKNGLEPPPMPPFMAFPK